MNDLKHYMIMRSFSDYYSCIKAYLARLVEVIMLIHLNMSHSTSIDYGWIQKESTSKTLWNLLFGENQVYESVDTIYAGVPLALQLTV